MIGLKLQQHGYENIDYAATGRQAVDAVRAAAFVYDCILMDVMMPEMSGLEATRLIRQDARYASTPIIGITGNCAVNDIRQCLDAGMSAALGKPIDTEKLFAFIQGKRPPIGTL